MESNVLNESLSGEIDEKFMKGKDCSFKLPDISLDYIEKILISLPGNKLQDMILLTTNC